MVFCVLYVPWGDERFPALSQRSWRRHLAIWSTELLQHRARLGDASCTILLGQAAHTGGSWGDSLTLNIYIFSYRCYHNKENMPKVTIHWLFWSLLSHSLILSFVVFEILLNYRFAASNNNFFKYQDSIFYCEPWRGITKNGYFWLYVGRSICFS